MNIVKYRQEIKKIAQAKRKKGNVKYRIVQRPYDSIYWTGKFFWVERNECGNGWHALKGFREYERARSYLIYLREKDKNYGKDI